MNDEPVSIYFGELAEASMVRATLDEQGVPAWLHQPHMSFLFSWWVHPGQGLTAKGQVVVPASEAQRALQVLEEVEAVESAPYDPAELPSTGLTLPLFLSVVLVALAVHALIWVLTGASVEN